MNECENSTYATLAEFTSEVSEVLKQPTAELEILSLKQEMRINTSYSLRITRRWLGKDKSERTIWPRDVVFRLDLLTFKCVLGLSAEAVQLKASNMYIWTLMMSDNGVFKCCWVVIIHLEAESQQNLSDLQLLELMMSWLVEDFYPNYDEFHHLKGNLKSWGLSTYLI